MSEHDRNRHRNQQHDHPDNHNQQHQNQQHSGNQHSGHSFDLAGAALDEMHAAGFKPEFGAGVAEEVSAIQEKFETLKPSAGVEDLRALGWSSIDNDTSKDLDQIEVAERVA